MYRNVAKFLEKTFQEQRQKGEEEKASLLQLCRGRTQKESARLFYETLVCPTILGCLVSRFGLDFLSSSNFWKMVMKFCELSRYGFVLQVLKTKGYLEVKQDHPYSDVLLTRLTRQQAAC